MDLSPQHLLQSPAADRLLSASDLSARSSTVLSRQWSGLPTFAAIARHHSRLDYRRRSLLDDGTRPTVPDTDLGACAIRAQSGVDHGDRLSRKHRSSHGDVSRARVIVLFARQIGMVWTFSGLELSDQNYPAPLVADLLFLLAAAASRRFVLAAICLGLPCFVGRTAAEVSGALSQECFVLRKLLGNLGHHLLVAPDQSSDVRDGNVLSFPADAKLRRHPAKAYHHRCRLNDCVAAAQLS